MHTKNLLIYAVLLLVSLTLLAETVETHEYIPHNELELWTKYELLKAVPLMPVLRPGDPLTPASGHVTTGRLLPIGTTILVIDLNDQAWSVPWYEVQVTSQDYVKGWINSIALIAPYPNGAVKRIED